MYVMTEIRVAWNVAGRTNRKGEPVNGGHWHPDSPENRKALRLIVESGIVIDGPGTHWIEARPKISPLELAMLI
jgi:hypothetical protein